MPGMHNVENVMAALARNLLRDGSKPDDLQALREAIKRSKASSIA